MTTAKMNIKQEAAIAALMSSPSIEEAAKSVGIGKQTLWRWLQDEEFKKAFKQAKRDAVSQSIAQLQASTSKAVKTLTDVMDDAESPASSKIQAAKTVLEFAYKGIELEDLEERIEELERLANEKTD